MPDNTSPLPAVAIAAFQLTQWAPRVALTMIARRVGRPLRRDEHLGLATWADGSEGIVTCSIP